MTYFKAILIFIVVLTSSDVFSTEKAKFSINRSGNTIQINNTNDFVSLIGKPPTAKFKNNLQFTKEMNSLVANIKDNKKMAKAFNILLFSKDISEQEKINWLNKNLHELPTPFFMLAAVLVAPNNAQQAEQLYIITNARLLIDLDKCNDPSLGGGIIILKQLLLPKLFTNLGLKVEDKKRSRKLFLKIEKDNVSRLVDLDNKYKQKPQYPYWLIDHGMKSFIQDRSHTGSDTTPLFKPRSSWPKLKMKVFNELLSYAKKRGNTADRIK